MTKKFKKTERVKNETDSQPTTETKNQSVSVDATSISSNQLVISDQVNLDQLVSSAKSNISSEPTKRKRRTKVEMLQSTTQGSQSPQVNVASIVIQDYVPTITLVLDSVDKIGSSYIASKAHVKASDLRSSQEDLKQAAQAINAPVNIIAAHLGANVNPLHSAIASVTITVTTLFISKIMLAEELKNVKNANE